MRHVSAVKIAWCIALIGPALIDASNAQTVRLGIFSSGPLLEVRARPSADLGATTITDVVVTVRWLTAYGIELGSVASDVACDKSGPVYMSGPYSYQKFYYKGWMNPVDWIGGGEDVLFSVPVTQNGTGTGTFELAPPGYPHGGDPYVQLGLESRIDTESPYYRASTEVALPVELSAFTAAVCDNTVRLTWRTAGETENAGFEVERIRSDTASSRTGIWETLAFVPGRGSTAAPTDYRYEDFTADHGVFIYRLRQIDRSGGFRYSNEIRIRIATPVQYSLQQNFPNPFNPMTMIRYTLAERSQVSIVLYDVVGRQAAVLCSGDQEAGSYSIPFDARPFPSGIYIYRMQARHGGAVFTDSKRFVLAK